MQDFNHPDPQNERRINTEPAQQNTQSENQQVAPPVPPVSQPQYQQPVPPVAPVSQPQYQQPVPPVAPVSQPQYQQPAQQNYQQPAQPTYQSPPQPQPVYQQGYGNQPQYSTQNNNAKSFPPVKTGEWMLTMFIMGIPLVGFIMLLVWAFSSGTNPSKSAWAKATLIWGVILTVIYVIIYLIIFLVAGFSVSSLNLGNF
jgi:hypothetical protein